MVFMFEGLTISHPFQGPCQPAGLCRGRIWCSRLGVLWETLAAVQDETERAHVFTHIDSWFQFWVLDIGSWSFSEGNQPLFVLAQCGYPKYPPKAQRLAGLHPLLRFWVFPIGVLHHKLFGVAFWAQSGVPKETQDRDDESCSSKWRQSFESTQLHSCL